MIRYVLDTDHLTLHFRGNPQVRQKLALFPPDEIAITVISAEEQLRGRLAQIRKASANEALATAHRKFRQAIYDLSKLNILEFDSGAITILEDMKRQRLRIGSQDMRIAAIALANNAIVVTRNRIDFGQIPGLTIEDWAARGSNSSGAIAIASFTVELIRAYMSTLETRQMARKR